MAGTTLDQVVVRGGAGAGGYAPQLTDIHVMDVQSPARFEYFDSYGSLPGLSYLISAYRPNELLSASNVPAGSDRIGGDEVAALLLRYPNAVLWVNGHTHRNQVLPHARTAGAAIGGGFWELKTAAHIDWPEQRRSARAARPRPRRPGPSPAHPPDNPAPRQTGRAPVLAEPGRVSGC
ncbi:MAG TPA: hypothetical protein VEM58_09160 [Streptosporangiaceae bacterium]|nr:hypothetical protein [Streptosporangiaceae bacterium]